MGDDGGILEQERTTAHPIFYGRNLDAVSRLSALVLNGDLEDIRRHMAVRSKEDDVCADLRSNSSISGFTALHHASMSGRVVFMRTLLQSFHYQDAGNVLNSVQAFKSETPFNLAVQHDHLEMAEYLLSRGADPHVSLDDGTTPVHMACQNLSLKMLQFLNGNCRTGCNYLDKPKSELKGDERPILLVMMASPDEVEKKRECLKYLLDCNVYPDTRDRDVVRPIVLAIRQRELWAAHLMLDWVEKKFDDDLERKTFFDDDIENAHRNIAKTFLETFEPSIDDEPAWANLLERAFQMGLPFNAGIVLRVEFGDADLFKYYHAFPINYAKSVGILETIMKHYPDSCRWYNDFRRGHSNPFHHYITFLPRTEQQIWYLLNADLKVTSLDYFVQYEDVYGGWDKWELYPRSLSPDAADWAVGRVVPCAFTLKHFKLFTRKVFPFQAETPLADLLFQVRRKPDFLKDRDCVLGLVHKMVELGSSVNSVLDECAPMPQFEPDSSFADWHTHPDWKCERNVDSETKIDCRYTLDPLACLCASFIRMECLEEAAETVTEIVRYLCSKGAVLSQRCLPVAVMLSEEWLLTAFLKCGAFPVEHDEFVNYMYVQGRFSLCIHHPKNEIAYYSFILRIVRWFGAHMWKAYPLAIQRLASLRIERQTTTDVHPNGEYYTGHFSDLEQIEMLKGLISSQLVVVPPLQLFCRTVIRHELVNLVDFDQAKNTNDSIARLKTRLPEQLVSYLKFD